MKINKVAILINVIAWAISFVWILPLMGILMASIRPYKEIVRGWWDFSEFNPSLTNIFNALYHPTAPLSKGIVNSLIVTIPATIMPIIIGALAAYAFARYSFTIKSYLFLTIVLLMAVPQQSIAIPLFQLMKKLGLLDSLIGLSIVHTAWGLPWIILFMKNFFATLPVEVEEAARIDGATDFQIFYKIVLPLSLPGIASVAALQFTWVWSDFFLALILIYSPDKLLATQRLPLMRGQYHVDWGVLSAA